MQSVHITLCAALLILYAAMAAIPPAAKLSYARPGDIILGGLFPLHFGNCETVPFMWSLQLVEAMVFAIDEINNRSDLLPNITLGFDIRDSCFDEDVALWSALSLVEADTSLYEPPSCQNRSTDFPRKVAGIVGPLGSAISIIVGAVADLYAVPTVAFAATSDELSDKKRFPFFLRTVPPDRLQAEAMVDIISHMGWEYVSIIYRADTYGIRGAHALARLAEERGVCVALSLPIREPTSHSDQEEIAAKLWEARKARVVVVFAGPTTSLAIVSAVEGSGTKGHFIWIGSEAWAHGASLRLGPPKGTVFISLHNPEPQGVFEYLSSLTRDAIARNPWFEIYLSNWEAVHNCTVWVDERCGIPHLEQYTTSSPMTPVVDAVYAFAYALQSLISSSNAKTVDGSDLLKHLREVNFEGQRGRFQFNSDGDMEGKYLLQNAQVEGGQLKFVTVGLWDALAPSQRLTFSREVVWGTGSTKIPSSTCRDVCAPGFRVTPLKEKCCFGCSPCQPYAVVFNGTECMDCEETEWPDDKRLSCIPIIPTLADWTDPLHLSITILSCMGLVLSMLIALGVTAYRNHSVIKATSRELSSVNITGLLLAFVAPFLLIAQPTAAICCLSQAMVSLCFTLAYASTLLKVSRIYRIFRASKKSARRPRLISPGEQLIMACILILIQVICVILTAALSSCEPQHLVPVPRDGHLELYCVLGTGFLVSCAYNLLLILACCVFAFLARKVPDNYNESKFIGVSVYSTLVACMAAIPVYSTSRDAAQKVAAICLAVLLNAYLTAACVYLPKLYAIRFLASASTAAAEDQRWASNRAHGSISQSVNSSRIQPSCSMETNKTL